jgi:cyanophycinase
MNIRVREDALSEDNIERLKNCDIVMVSGGNQLRLSSIYGGTPLLDMCRERYFNEHFVIAGTSAGAMSMSGTMIYEGNAANAHLKGEVRITTGLGFVNNAIIDTHFDKRGRFNRLVQAVAAQPGAIGIGLGEDTGVIVHQGHQLEVIGMGSVIIIDGSKVDYTNIGDLEFGAPLSISNMTVHMMSAGDQYDLKKRTFLASTKVAHMENH